MMHKFSVFVVNTSINRKSKNISLIPYHSILYAFEIVTFDLDIAISFSNFAFQGNDHLNFFNQ